MMKSKNRMILCLGSNVEKERNIECAVNLLRTHFVSISFSEPMITDPINCSSSESFLNQVAVLYTDQDAASVKAILKQIERTIGRKPEDKSKGLIPIDIDLLQFNEIVLKEEDLHRAYVKQGLLAIEKN